jgi:hypothetical protein
MLQRFIIYSGFTDVEELFLKTFLISQISVAKIDALEANTRGRANSVL